MIDIAVLTENPELAKSIRLEVSPDALREFAEVCFEKGKQLREEPKPEKYLTPQEYAETLQVSLVTLWHMDKKGLTKPVYFGASKRYRLSDVEKFLQER